jgi:hypothetical protein
MLDFFSASSLKQQLTGSDVGFFYSASSLKQQSTGSDVGFL